VDARETLPDALQACGLKQVGLISDKGILVDHVKEMVEGEGTTVFLFTDIQGESGRMKHSWQLLIICISYWPTLTFHCL
jgi:hypothetical protein